MKVFVVNLERDRERLEDVRRQLDAAGVAFERFPAVDGAALSAEELRRVHRPFLWRCHVGAPARAGEIGCALTHHGLWRRLVEEKLPAACVLEDDIILRADLKDILSRLEGVLRPDEPEVYLLTNYTAAPDDGPFAVRETDQNRSTEAYVLTREAAKRLLKVNAPLTAPCDHWRRFAFLGGVRIRQVVPTAVKIHEARFGSYTFPEGTPRISLRALGLFRWLRHKTLRALGLFLDRGWEIWTRSF